MTKHVEQILRSPFARGLSTTIVLWMISALPAMCQRSISVIEPDFPGITVASPSPAHVSAATARASSVLNVDITTLMPYGVLITNIAGTPITALDILYTCDVRGKQITQNFFYHASDLISPIEPLLFQSKALLVTPHHRVNMGLIFAEHNSDPSQKVDTASTLEFFGKCERITASADLVIFSGGEVYGPDTAGTLRKFQDRLDEYRDFRTSLLKELQGNEPDSELLAWLRKEADAPVMKRRGEHSIDYRGLERKLVAQEYLAVIRNSQRSEAIIRLQNNPVERVFGQYMRLKRM